MLDGVLAGKANEPVYKFKLLFCVGVWTGISFNISLVMRSVLISHSAMSRWILRRED